MSTKSTVHGFIFTIALFVPLDSFTLPMLTPSLTERSFRNR
jgi:hypothetical protein